MGKLKGKKLGILLTSFCTIAVAASVLSIGIAMNQVPVTAGDLDPNGYTLTLNSENGQLAGDYSASVNTNSDAVTTSGNHIEMAYYNVGILTDTSLYAQMKESSGYLYNTDTIDLDESIYPINNIKTITAIFSSTSSPTLYYGSTENPSTNGMSLTSGTPVEVTSGTNFFKIEAGSSVVTISSLVITYICGASEPVLQNVSITDSNTKYSIGSTYSTDNGLTVTGVYNTGNKVIPSGYIINGIGFDPTEAFSVAGYYSVTVTYQSITSNTLDFSVYDPSVATNITLNKTTLSLSVNESEQLSYTLAPVTATNSVVWSSNKTACAIVNSTSGLVSAIKAGEATITATTNNGLTASCVVTISNASDSAGTYSLISSLDELSIDSRIVFSSSDSGSVYAMSATQGSNNRPGVSTSVSNSEITLLESSSFGSFVVKEETTNGTYAFYDENNNGYLCAASSNSNYLRTESTLSANSSFSITISSGSASLTASGSYSRKNLRWNSNNKIFSCYSSGQAAVYLFQKESTPIYATSISMNPTTASIGVNETSNLAVTFNPSNTNQKAIAWESSNSSVVSVSNGVITGKSAGNATITATVATDGEGGKTSATCSITVSTIAVTGVSLPSTLTIGLNSSSTLSATISPSNATNKNVSFNSSNTSVATVDNSGLVSGLALGTSTITVTTADGSFTDSCLVTVEEVSNDYTIMIYICGADLESENYLATSNITEILSVTYPEGVNVIIETGGAKSWSSKYSISSSKLSRYHVSNKSLVLDETLTNASMGKASTFQSFVEWGLREYPAKQTGVVMWNHGGAMEGCCYDENYSNDSLTNNEVHTALGSAFSSLGRTDNLNWIGYDCCLMAVSDIASYNSDYFNYMVSAQESEPGEGWDYDVWLKTLASNSSIDEVTLLKKICDSFISKCGGTSSSNDGTLSVLDLAYMDDYKEVWETMAASLAKVITSSSVWSTFASLCKICEQFGYSSGTYYYNIYDAQDFIDAMQASSTFKNVSGLSNLETILANVCVYSAYGGYYNKSSSQDPCGLCIFAPATNNVTYSYAYASGETPFTTWQSLVNTYADWY